MPLELQRLQEQLNTLTVLYQDLIKDDKAIEEKYRIKDQILKLEKLIDERKQLIIQSSN